MFRTASRSLTLSPLSFAHIPTYIYIHTRISEEKEEEAKPPQVTLCRTTTDHSSPVWISLIRVLQCLAPSATLHGLAELRRQELRLRLAGAADARRGRSRGGGICRGRQLPGLRSARELGGGLKKKDPPRKMGFPRWLPLKPTAKRTTPPRKKKKEKKRRYVFPGKNVCLFYEIPFKPISSKQGTFPQKDLRCDHSGSIGYRDRPRAKGKSWRRRFEKGQLEASVAGLLIVVR